MQTAGAPRNMHAPRPPRAGDRRPPGRGRARPSLPYAGASAARAAQRCRSRCYSRRAPAWRQRGGRQRGADRPPRPSHNLSCHLAGGAARRRTALALAPRLALRQAHEPRGQRLHARLQRIARRGRCRQAPLGRAGGRSCLRAPRRARGGQLRGGCGRLRRAALRGAGQALATLPSRGGRCACAVSRPMSPGRRPSRDGNWQPMQLY